MTNYCHVFFLDLYVHGCSCVQEWSIGHSLLTLITYLSSEVITISYLYVASDVPVSVNS